MQKLRRPQPTDYGRGLAAKTRTPQVTKGANTGTRWILRETRGFRYKDEKKESGTFIFMSKKGIAVINKKLIEMSTIVRTVVFLRCVCA